jgi:hypothetical protein
VWWKTEVAGQGLEESGKNLKIVFVADKGGGGTSAVDKSIA